MKKFIVWAIVILAIGTLLWVVGKSKIQTPTPRIEPVTQAIKNNVTKEGVIATPEIFYDFGKISMKNGDVSKSFTVTNQTTSDVSFPSLTTSCMCTRAYFVQSDGSKKGPFGMPGMGFVPKLNEIIKPGQSATIEVVYDPNAHGPAGVGMIDRFVYLEDTNKNKFTFEIKANVTP